MKAATTTRYGPPDVLTLVNIPTPVPNNNQLLIEVDSSAVTASDTVVRKLEAPGVPGPIKKQLLRFAMRMFLGFGKPRNAVLGLIVAGKVVDVGSNISSFKKGDPVYGFAGMSFGGYAEYKLMSRKEIDNGGLALKPDNISFEEAAAIVYGGVLATHFLQPKTLQKGERVLIYGASGAIGTAAIQLAKAREVEVTAVCSRKNVDTVRSLGADHVIDYTQMNATGLLKTYDRIFDAVGFKKSSPLKVKLNQCLKAQGRYVSVDDHLMKQKAEYMEQLNEAIQSGRLKASIDRIYPLEEIVTAHRYVDTGHKVGNVVVKVADSQPGSENPNPAKTEAGAAL